MNKMMLRSESMPHLPTNQLGKQWMDEQNKRKIKLQTAISSSNFQYFCKQAEKFIHFSQRNTIIFFDCLRDLLKQYPNYSLFFSG
jgi:hypothetical protein